MSKNESAKPMASPTPPPAGKSRGPSARARLWIILGAIALGIIIAIIVVTASNSGSTKPNASSTSNSGSAPYINASPGPGFIKSAVNGSTDVTDKKCVSQGSSVVASGNLANPEGAVQDYRIYVYVMDGQTQKALQLVSVNNVGAHAKEAWTGTIPVNVPNPSCIYRVERNAPGAK